MAVICQANLALLESRGVRRVGPGEGPMACGEFGLGRMAEPAEILAAIEAMLTTDGALKVEIRLENRGVAPFYYRWPVWIGVADASGAIVASFRTDWDLTRAVDPRKPVTLKRTVRGHGLPAGSYTLLLRAQNPLANGPPLAFANAGWQKDVVGWVSLGAFRVRSR